MGRVYLSGTPLRSSLTAANVLAVRVGVAFSYWCVVRSRVSRFGWMCCWVGMDFKHTIAPSSVPPPPPTGSRVAEGGVERSWTSARRRGRVGGGVSFSPPISPDGNRNRGHQHTKCRSANANRKAQRCSKDCVLSVCVCVMGGEVG